MKTKIQQTRNSQILIKNKLLDTCWLNHTNYTFVLCEYTLCVHCTYSIEKHIIRLIDWINIIENFKI